MGEMFEKSFYLNVGVAGTLKRTALWHSYGWHGHCRKRIQPIKGPFLITQKIEVQCFKYQGHGIRGGIQRKKINRNSVRNRVIIPYTLRYSMLPSTKYEPGYKRQKLLKNEFYTLSYKNSWLLSEKPSLLFQIFFSSPSLKTSSSSNNDLIQNFGKPQSFELIIKVT